MEKNGNKETENKTSWPMKKLLRSSIDSTIPYRFNFFSELNEHIVLIICTCTVLTAGDVFILQRICGWLTLWTFASLRLEYMKFKPFRKRKLLSKEHSRYIGKNKNTKIDSNLFLHSLFLSSGQPLRSLPVSQRIWTANGFRRPDLL